MGEADRHERAADGLCRVTQEMEDVDLNALLDEDAQSFLSHKQALEEMCRRYRRDQHAAERSDR
ncbi:hypothetical protein [Haloplanus natans]|uniref:hypothetical protein n=1 Tax=Haloplanus natans TaxID=376171 RepID=UPI00067781E4|nr:hypothetical protein [Haloplanus natans]